MAFAGSTQAYGAIVNLTLPTNIAGHAPSTAGTTREYYNVETGVTSTSSASNYDLNLGYYNNSTPNEYFTGIYVNGGTGLVSYYASNATNYAYGLALGKTLGTGGNYATFGQKAGYYSILALTYNGTAYAIMQQNTPYYLGFQFLAADGLQHNGWMQVESDAYVSAANPGGFRFLGGAYNTTPNGTAAGLIAVGQTAAVPEPGTLAALAMGASALVGVGLKRRRAARAAATLAA